MSGAQRMDIRLLPWPGWRDHHFQGRPVLPAVEALQLLADQAQRFDPRIDPTRTSHARFPRFLEIDPDAAQLVLHCDLTALPGGLRAALVSRIKSGTAGLTRSVVHAEVLFAPSAGAGVPLPLDLAGSLTGPCSIIAPERIYAELVPFGPCFRSLCAPLSISAEGALARVHAPQTSPRGGTLGSPFPLDGALHAACVWGQRYAGMVGFPVGYASRVVYAPTCSGQEYFVRIVPLAADPPSLLFDLWLFDRQGEVREAVRGLRLQDVSRGAWRPPAWVADGAGCEQPEWVGRWERSCAGMVIMERAAVSPLAELGLSRGEALRAVDMGCKRRGGYISARLACKRLWRRLAGDDRCTAAQDLETIVSGQPYPRLPVKPGGAAWYCSVSHDDRFTVVAAGETPIGVDVEKIAARALQTGTFFMHPTEQALIDRKAVDSLEAALRIWSIKECVAKARNLKLAEAWRVVEVVALGAERSRLHVADGSRAQALHGELQGHLFTLVSNWE